MAARERKYNFAIDFDDIIDDSEKSSGMQPIALSRGAFVEDAISTGSLAIDLIVGGGWAPGRWITLYGLEQSGKSTLSYFALGDAVKQGVPSIFADHEGSTEANYLERILGLPLSELQGLRDEKGEWIKKPSVRYYPGDVGETTFKFLHRILKRLPDKIKGDDQWFLVYEKDYKGDFKDTDYDKKLYKRTGKIWVPCDSGSAQLLIFIDSLPGMLAGARDENDDKSAMAAQARMFSENIPLIRGFLRRKRATVIATNQIRLRPMMMFGNPEYEPCGEAPKFFADARVRMGTIANPRGKGQIEEEDSWDEESKDRYRFTKLRTVKNKMFSPFREATLRMWFEEAGQPGRGIDPVWDAYEFLSQTGQIERLKGGYEISMPGPWKGKKLTWADFKWLILNPNKLEVAEFFKVKLDDEMKELRKKRKDRIKSEKGTAKIDAIINKNLRKVDLRRACKKQLQDSSAFKLYFDTLGGSVIEKKKKESTDM